MRSSRRIATATTCYPETQSKNSPPFASCTQNYGVNYHTDASGRLASVAAALLTLTLRLILPFSVRRQATQPRLLENARPGYENVLRVWVLHRWKLGRDRAAGPQVLEIGMAIGVAKGRRGFYNLIWILT